MPIYINVPGGGLSGVGEGLSAAQGYRANEQRAQLIDQEAARKNEAFEFEKATTLRSIELDEQNQELEREQLAQAQEAEADVLVGMALESGAPVGDQNAYRQALARTAPQFRRQMAVELGRATRLKAEQAETSQLLARAENLGGGDIKQRIQSGEIRDLADLRRAVERAEVDEAKSMQQETDRTYAVEAWGAWQKDPAFDLPDEGEEAYEDVQKRLASLLPGGAPRGDVRYRQVLDELMLLTNKRQREAALRILEADMAKRPGEPMPEGVVGQAAGDPGFRARVQGQAYEEQAAEDRAGAAAAGFKPAKGGGSSASTEPGKMLDEDLGANRKRKLYGSDVDADVQAELQDALDHLGFTSMPKKGEPGYEVALAAFAALEQRRTRKQQETISTQANKPTRGSMQ